MELRSEPPGRAPGASWAIPWPTNQPVSQLASQLTSLPTIQPASQQVTSLQDPGSRIWDPGSRIQDPGIWRTRNPTPGSSTILWIQDPGSFLSSRSTPPHQTRFWIQIVNGFFGESPPKCPPSGYRFLAPRASLWEPPLGGLLGESGAPGLIPHNISPLPPPHTSLRLSEPSSLRMPTRKKHDGGIAQRP